MVESSDVEVMGEHEAMIDKEEVQSEEEDLPYGKGAFDAAEKADSESTHSAADSPRLSSRSADFSGGSDDELRAGGSRRRSPHSEPLSDTLRLGFQGDAFSEEPGSGLVDLDPAEGRRRGKELLALLQAPLSESEESGTSKAASSVPSVPCLPMRPSMTSANAGGAREGVSSPSSSGGSSPFVGVWVPAEAVDARSGAFGFYCAPQFCRMSTASRVLCGQHYNAVSEAASKVFGLDLAEVAPRSSGFALSIRRLKAGRAQLDAFACALWPLLAPEAVSMQSHPSTEAGVSSWLSLWCLDRTASCAQRMCWDYVRTGACPRIGRCRWLHAAPPTYRISIELKSTC